MKFTNIPPTREKCIEYLEEQGLLEYFSVGETQIKKPPDSVTADDMIPIAPQVQDLYYLHKTIRQRKVFNILEFGIGFSTIVMADALKKNREDFLVLDNPIEMRISNPFHIYSVDASEHWIDYFQKTYEKCSLMEYITISFSKCNIGEHNGQICHFYKNLPNVIADFMFIDGPDPKNVDGDINGISFKNCPERTVMSGDLLKLEPTLLPGSMILIDGRTNNARFLKNNLKRQYEHNYSEEWDLTSFELTESPLGKINKTQLDYQYGEGYY